MRWWPLDWLLPTYVATSWPTQQGSRTVYVHVVRTRVRRLYRCQVVIIRESLDAPLTQARCWASSDLEADTATLLGHITARWEVEVLFGDVKEVLGLDHYQVLSATGVVRFWTLVLAAYVFLKEEQARLQQTERDHVTIGDTHAPGQDMGGHVAVISMADVSRAGFRYPPENSRPWDDDVAIFIAGGGS